MSEEITLDTVIAAIERLYEMEAVHIKRGFCITKATPAVATNHMIEEAVELQAATLFEGKNEQLGEAADLLGVFLHVLRFCGINIHDVILLTHTKLGKTFTTDPELVTALRDGFTRAGRAETPDVTTACEHKRMMAYTEDGDRFHACRDCGKIWQLVDQLVHDHRNSNSWHKDFVIEILCRYISEQGAAAGLADFLDEVASDEEDYDPEDTGNAGCDKCGMFDRVEGSKFCAGCKEDAEDSNPDVAADDGTNAGAEPGPR